MRELGSNSVDAIRMRILSMPPEEVTTFKKRIEFIYMKNGDIWCIDNGTGIRDLEKFMEIAKNSYKTDAIEEEYTIDQRIGNFHVGKLTFVMYSGTEMVTFKWVDSTEVGFSTNLYPNKKDELHYDPATHCKAALIKPDQGLIVIIRDVPKHRTMPLEKLKEYLGEVFAPWILYEHFEFLVHYEGMPAEQVLPPVEYGQNRYEYGTLSDGSKVWGNLKKGKEAGKLFVYKNGVLIQRDLDFGKKMDYLSYVNITTRGIQTNFARDSFQTDPEDSPLWEEFVELVAKTLEELEFEDAKEKKERPQVNNGDQVKESAIRSLQTICELYPFNTPPELLEDFGIDLELTQKIEDGAEKKIKKIVNKLLPKQRKKRGQKTGKKRPESKKTDKKNKKRKTRQDVEKTVNDPDNTEEGKKPPKIEVVKDTFGMTRACVFFNKIQKTICVNESRPATNTMFNSVTLPKAAHHEITRAMMKAIPEFENLPVDQFDDAYYKCLDKLAEERNS